MFSYPVLPVKEGIFVKQMHITETVLRDAQQSLIATRMPFDDFEAVLDDMDKAGYHSIECWGGATFDSLPALPARGSLGASAQNQIRKHEKHQAADAAARPESCWATSTIRTIPSAAFVRRSVENGIDIIRIFDALNDMRNIETAVDECLKAGGDAQGTYLLTRSAPFTHLENCSVLPGQAD